MTRRIEHPEEFKYFCEVILFWRREKKSHADARRAEGWRLHSSLRDELVSAFKVRRMAWRVAADPDPRVKYTLSEGDLFKQLCRMDPIYNRRPN